MSAAASCMDFGSPRLAAKSLVDPAGIYPSNGRRSRFIIPVTASFKVPSPPLTTSTSIRPA